MDMSLSNWNYCYYTIGPLKIHDLPGPPLPRPGIRMRRGPGFVLSAYALLGDGFKE